MYRWGYMGNDVCKEDAAVEVATHQVRQAGILIGGVLVSCREHILSLPKATKQPAMPFVTLLKEHFSRNRSRQRDQGRKEGAVGQGEEH